MPVYPFRCECGEYVEELRKVEDVDLPMVCKKCGQQMEFVYGSGRKYIPFPPLYIKHVRNPETGELGMTFNSLAEIRKYEYENRHKETCIEGFSYNGQHGDDGR